MTSDELLRQLVHLVGRLVITVEEMNEKLERLLSQQSLVKSSEQQEPSLETTVGEDIHADRVSDVVSIIREKGAMSADELARYFNIQRSTASYYLNQAVKQGILKKFRESRTKKVFFSPIKHSSNITKKKKAEKNDSND